MNTRLLSAYQRLPYPARMVAASARGASLYRWRYGRNTAALVAAAAAREQWSVERWQAWQAAQLRDLLVHAAGAVPHYRRDEHRSADLGNLADWAVLPKQRVRESPRDFLADGCNPKRMFEDHTSGTTGTPVAVWLSRTSVREWYALFERRVRNWNGVDKTARWGILGGQLVTPASRTRPPYWVWNAAGHQLYLSAFHISADTARDYRDAIARHKVKYLLGYPSALAALAQEIAARRLDAPRLEVVLTNAEPLAASQRAIISSVFGCPVRDTYGMSEAVAAGSECEAGSLHMWPDAGVVEVLRDDEDVPAAPGEVGRLVCTGLINHDMPLIRYDIGDRGAVSWRGDCACGRACRCSTRSRAASTTLSSPPTAGASAASTGSSRPTCRSRKHRSYRTASRPSACSSCRPRATGTPPRMRSRMRYASESATPRFGSSRFRRFRVRATASSVRSFHT